MKRICAYDNFGCLIDNMPQTTGQVVEMVAIVFLCAVGAALMAYIWARA